MKAALSIKFILLLLILANSLYAQLASQDTVSMLVDAAKLQARPQLFVHYDENIYLPNERIWFTAYLLNSRATPEDALLLSMFIVNEADKSIAYSKKFVFSAETSSGTMMIPDSIRAGEYTIIAYPGLLVDGKPDPVFYQSISIRHPGVSSTASGSTKSPKTPVKQLIQFKFYPEGGQLVSGLPSYVGWEARDTLGATVNVDAILLRDEVPIDTLRSSEMGMGRFPISASTAHRYRLIATGPYVSGSSELPIPIQKGISISIPSAAAGDTLRLKISSNLGSKIHLVVHNNQEVFLVMPNLHIENSRNFRIMLDSVPKGLASITIFGADFLPLAERLFYAHYGEPDAVQITTGAEAYGKKQKVELELDLKSVIDTAALLSLAVVKSNRISRAAFNDIENYQFLKQELAFHRFPTADATRKAYIEDVLMIKGWTKYKRQASNEMPKQIDRLSGAVTINKRVPKKPMQLTLMSNSTLFFVHTDSTGRFNLANSELLVEDERPLNLFALGKYETDANISITNPYSQHNLTLAASTKPFTTMAVAKNMNIEPLMPLTEGIISLKTVTVKGKTGDEYHGINLGPKKNACGDYVCRAGFLNCPLQGHDITVRLPVKGETYNTFSGSGNVSRITYIGCETSKKVTRVDAANLGKEFYAYGKEEMTSGDTLYSSTLYWAPATELTKGKKKLFSFYTGDIGGMFTIVVQGITPTGTIYTEKNFEIKP